MKSVISLILASALVGPPAPDKAQKVDDVKALYHHGSKLKWVAIGTIVVSGTIIALKVSEPKLKQRRIGGICCGPNCLLAECHIPEGGY